MAQQQQQPPSLGVLKTGPLEVLTRGGPLLQPVWRPRYVVLTTTALHYYLRGGDPAETTASKLLAGDGLAFGDGGLFGHHRGSVALGDVERAAVEDGALRIRTKGSSDEHGEGEASQQGRTYAFRGGDCEAWREALERQRGTRGKRASTLTGDYRGAPGVALVTAFEASGREYVVAHAPAEEFAAADVSDVTLAVDAALLAIACEATSTLPAVTTRFAAAGDLGAAAILDACDAFLGVLAALGPAMALGVKDFRANAAKARRHAAPSLAASLRAEKRAHKPGGVLKDPSVAVGFLWLRRTLAFQVGINRYALAADGPVALAAAAKRAYADELEPVHGWLLRGVFGAALNNVPAWDAYLVAVAPQVPAEYRPAVVRRDLEAFNAALVPLLAAWKQLFIDLDLEDVRRV